jgi:hypothetical protein
VGDPLTRHFLLSDDGNGMPLLSAVATRQDFSGQRAKLRGKSDIELTMEAPPWLLPAALADMKSKSPWMATTASMPDWLSIRRSMKHCRSPLDRIIAAAERIVDRSEGPLRSDYAAYAGDIAAAGRHLLSVVHSITDQQAFRVDRTAQPGGLCIRSHATCSAARGGTFDSPGIGWRGPATFRQRRTARRRPDPGQFAQ